ncbi:MAG: KEOPS complex subunit Pcc1 [Candidatus Bathyarchaeia archaeon]
MIGEAYSVIKVDLGRVEVNRIVYEVLKPEARSLPSRRVEGIIGLDENGVIVLEIRASDTIALRAAVNSYMRLLKAVKSALDVVYIYP